jgi:tRNA A-37 threonylcarbamoyl transferase component Bud32
MPKLLPGSSDPTVDEIRRLQGQCDRLKVQDRLHTLDEQDEERCLKLLSEGGLDSQTTSPLAHRLANLQLVGHGSFGLVFSGNDSNQHGKRVAIKILRPSRQRDRIARERFQEESRVMSELQHPNIVEVYEIGELEDLPYMMVEFADAGNLAGVLQESPDYFTIRQAAWLVSRIADAVAQAHTSPVLHRDIKPGNILLRREDRESSEGLGLWPLLTDFGLSKNLNAVSTIPLTFAGEVLGTLSYMSPEQVQGSQLKTQSDVFPLGVILHELVYWKHPFLAESDFQTRTNIVHSAPAKPHTDSRHGIRQIDAIIAKCLQKSPEARYLHASDLVTDLTNFLAGEPISVSPPTAWQTFSAWVRAHPITTTLLTTIFCCVIAVIFLLNREWRMERDYALASQALAEDRAKIGRLFLQSMRATNSEINDTILSGRRVEPSSLLKTLERQIPLLEDALALNPSDVLLIRQLEIMYHYKSLSHVYAIASPDLNEDRGGHTKMAIETRQKSLDFIHQLIHRNPDDANLLVSRLNGEYLMGTIPRHQSEYAERLRWVSKAKESAEQFLRTYPEHSTVLESIGAIHLEWCRLKMHEEPEACISLLEETIDNNIELFSKDTTRSSVVVYALEGHSMLLSLLLNANRHREGMDTIRRFESLVKDHFASFTQEWQMSETLQSYYARTCEILIPNGMFQEVLEITPQWQSIVSASTKPDFIFIQGHRFHHQEFASLLPMYYHWLALSEIAPQSPPWEQKTLEFYEFVQACKALSPLDFDEFTKIIQKSRLDDLENFINANSDENVSP